ncbi:Bifunctional solanapyrone synthase [Lachnellula cervina]|uniref:Bifunctional solanapyrone synthase n=1 Tax=Lachnellula cervina TaxID=1316786 RepID=A0A7D8UKY9_9HELO|nr:Bifunctional solanapyrone synthase [Lachnellula cervina]
MALTFESFLGSVGLSGTEAQSLTGAYVGKSSSPLALACQVAQLCLGQDNVHTAPLNQTLVDENWSQVVISEPYCILQPSNTNDVSNAVKIISYFQVKFAVRSGGHSPNPGFSSIGQGGVLLDLQKLDQIVLSSDKSVASLGPGGRWGDVISTLDAQGATVIGGRIPDVGVGGLILGGGFSHYSGEFGLAADNVKNFEIVLADGTVTAANAALNSDLFWALKGGGPNFGIVTRFDLNTVPVGQIWYQVTVYSVDQAHEVLDAFVEWQNNGASDVKSTVALIMGLQSITVGLIYSEPTEQPSAFAPFYSLTALAVAVPGTIGTNGSLTILLGMSASSTIERHDYRAASSRIDSQLYKDVYAFWRERALVVHGTTGANQTFCIQPVPANLAEEGIAKGGNPMGIPTENHQWWTTLIDWTNASDDEAVRQVSIDTTNQWKALGEERKLWLPHLFMNDASRDQNPIGAYGDDNVAKLKEIALKYDKNRVFQTLQNGGFLLSEVN